MLPESAVSRAVEGAKRRPVYSSKPLREIRRPRIPPDRPFRRAVGLMMTYVSWVAMSSKVFPPQEGAV